MTLAIFHLSSEEVTAGTQQNQVSIKLDGNQAGSLLKMTNKNGKCQMENEPAIP
jgi:hypothetical protein